MININNLSFGYKKQDLLYDGLNLELSGGSIVGLLGKNGAGKTTLLKLVAGLLKAKGNTNIKSLGFNPGKRHPDMLADICFIPEEFDLPSTSMKCYVEAVKSYYPRFSMEKLDDVLREFELDKDRKLNKLSYGQKKKFLIALTLASGSRLLILDEPSNGLDIPSKALFRKVMAGSLTEDQLVVISTHQVKDIEAIIDRVLIVDSGKVILNHSVFDITKDYAFFSTAKPEQEDVIYKEAVPGGYKVITKRDGDETDLDIEILFNACTQGIMF